MSVQKVEWCAAHGSRSYNGTCEASDDHPEERADCRPDTYYVVPEDDFLQAVIGPQAPEDKYEALLSLFDIEEDEE